jgi:hypothetical protein
VSLLVAKRNVRCGKGEHHCTGRVEDGDLLCVVSAGFALISKDERELTKLLNVVCLENPGIFTGMN